ncbi:phosphoribosyltransferase [Myroides marinus]|uniref:phosphoribosyltransferase n=1 Tax=Myroides marinus TaxID=703342 RepID=UPI0025771441|nr:phosphoribosyltransferase [Myroides marinus]MDM1350937.1 phosphoribosyltransferase [Myroides marinus]MDM1358144.1 phosphoribosyltransferase [Myroides marinus]
MKTLEKINSESSVENVFTIMQLIESHHISNDDRIKQVRNNAEQILKGVSAISDVETINNPVVYYQVNYCYNLLQRYIGAFNHHTDAYNSISIELREKLISANAFKSTLSSSTLTIDPKLPLSIYSDLCQRVPMARSYTKWVSGEKISLDYLFDYRSSYSMNILVDPIFKSVSEDFIYNFKEGEYSEMLPIILATHIYKKYKNVLDKGNVCLCVIPSSTKDRSNLRFKALIKKVSYLLSIENGFDLITRSKDRKDSREQNKHSIDVLDGVNFDAKLNGKTVILLDDVTTMGTSIQKFDQKLKQLGVNQAIDIVLAKTYYVIGTNLPMPELIKANKDLYNLL